MANNNQRIVFNLPAHITKVEIIDDILKSNGLEESNEEFLDKDANGEEPRLIIIRDAAITMVQKKIPEEKLIEFLMKHLGVKKPVVEKIVADIKEKLIPYAKIIDLEKEERENEQREKEIEKNMEVEYRKEDIQKALLQKIKSGQNISEPESEEKDPTFAQGSGVAKPKITDVDKNAEKMNEEGKNIITKERELMTADKPAERPQAQGNKPDPYKELID